MLDVILEQMIREGCGVFYISPKGERYLPHTLAAAAEHAGRPFIYLDLNGAGPGRWSPFAGGEARDARTRLVLAFNLQSLGTDADVYLARERRVVDELVANTNLTVPTMVNYLREHELEETPSEGYWDV